MEIKVKKLDPRAITPAFAHDGDACADLHALEDVRIHEGETKLIKTGIAIAVPPGYEALIRPRSGMALNDGITILNSPGTVDSGYRGDVGIILHNAGTQAYMVVHGSRIAQLAIRKTESIKFLVVEDLNATTRGAGGFGSTGV